MFDKLTEDDLAQLQRSGRQGLCSSLLASRQPAAVDLRHLLVAPAVSVLVRRQASTLVLRSPLVLRAVLLSSARARLHRAVALVSRRLAATLPLLAMTSVLSLGGLSRLLVVPQRAVLVLVACCSMVAASTCTALLRTRVLPVM